MTDLETEISGQIFKGLIACSLGALVATVAWRIRRDIRADRKNEQKSI